jgi:hypothetical protein
MRRFGLSGLVGLCAVAGLLVFSAGAGAQGEVQHGIGFTKGCTSPVKVGDPYSCSYAVRNILDAAEDTLTINGLTDIVHAAGGDVNSGNILGSVEITTTTTPTGATPSGATCTATGGTGVFPTPYTGVTSCTLPAGSRVNVLSFSHYVVQAGDFALFEHKLRDDAFLTWHDLCNDPAGTGNTNCDPNPTPTSASSLATVTQLSSSTATDIHNAAHQVVTTVEVGSTVHDFVTVTGEAGKPNPSGNVTIDWFLNATCEAPAATTSAPIALDAAGQVDATGFAFTVMTPGMRAFRAHYAGDAAYAGSDGPCEPLQVVDAYITITPAEATNPVGTTHTYTAHVFTNAGLGPSYVAPPDGTLVTFTLLAGSVGSFSAGNTCVTVAGDCTIVTTSASPGDDTMQASTTLAVAGVTMTRTTGQSAPGHANGPNAIKHWQGGGGQITPTQVSCQDFLAGAPTLDQVNYSVSSGKIDRGINPGVFFYWTKITTTVPNQVVTTSQTNTSTNNSALFKIHQDWQRLYTGNCSSWTTGTQIAGGTGASFTVPTPGTYVIGIKYDVKSLSGTTPPVPADITFNFATSLGGNTGASVLLKKK